jgi:DNA-binding NarL/FixJ family response regulator
MPSPHSCLAGIKPSFVPFLTVSLAAFGFTNPVVVERIKVTELGLANPNILVLDLDDSETDPLELLRMIRFVLPGCTIAVYSGRLEQSWALACHLAGANCVLANSSKEDKIALGLREALTSGSFTDPSFVAA